MSEQENQADDKLINAILESSPGFEEKLFNQYAQRLSHYARLQMPNKLQGRLDSDDVVQSVFRSFFRRNRNGEFSFDESLDLWRLLIAMTYRKVLTKVRHHTREKRNVSKEGFQHEDENAHPSLADLSPGPEQINIMVDLLEWILEQLPEQSRIIVGLRLEGFSIAEVADQVNVSQRTVKRVVARVREIVQRHVESENQA